jgi:tetratricopeptide (TPR) repeat protein
MTRARLLLCVLLAPSIVSLSACDYFRSPEGRVARAEKLFAEGDRRLAAIELKNALQDDPKLAGAHLLMAEIGLLMGDAKTAERELDLVPAGAEAARVADLRTRIDLAAGRFDTVYERLPATSPDAKIRVYRGQALMGTKQPALAEVEFRAALKLDPSQIDAQVGLAEARVAQGDSKGAQVITTAATRAHPQSALAWLTHGTLLAQRGDLKGADESLTKASELAPKQLDFPRQANMLSTLIEARIALQNLEGAKSASNQLSRIVPGSPAAVLLAARVAMASNDYTSAANQLRRVVNGNPKFTRARFLLGVTLAAQGNLEQASFELTTVLDQTPENVEARELLAQLRLRLQDPDGALRALVPALEANPLDGSLGQLFAAARNQADVSGSALPLLAKELERAPNNFGLRRQLAAAYQSRGEDRKTLELLGEVPVGQLDAPAARLLLTASEQIEGRALAAKRLDAMMALKKDQADFNVLLAQFHASGGDIDAARKVLSGAIGRLPEKGGLRLALAQLEFSRGSRDAGIEQLQILRREDAQAVPPRLILAQIALQRDAAKEGDALIAEAIAGATDIPGTRNIAGLLYLGTGRYDDAAVQFRAGIEADPKNAMLLLNLGRAQLALDQGDAARASLLQALEVRPAWIPAEGALAFFYLQQGNSKEALQRIGNLKRAAPKDPDVLQLEGEIQAALRNFDEAEKAYNAAATLRPSGTLAVKIYQARVAGQRPNPTGALADWIRIHPEDNTVRSILAEALVRAGSRRPAAEQYEELAARRPRDVAVINNLAWLYYELADARALATARKAHALSPTSPSVSDTLGWILVDSGNVAEGLAILERAAADAPTVGDIQFHYAAGLAKAGRRPQAVARLRTLLQAPEPFATRQQAEQLLFQLSKSGS